MNDFIAVTGNIDYQKVTLQNGEEFRQACLDRGNSKATVAKKLRYLKRLFRLAVNRKQLDENPLQHIDMPKTAKKKVKVYSPSECERIVKAAKQFQDSPLWNRETSVRWDLLVTVALLTAMKRGELLNATWCNVDFEEQTISVSAKDDSDETWEWLIKDTDERTLPLTDEVIMMLAEHQGEQDEGYPYIFVPKQRYEHIQSLRQRNEWSLPDSRLKVINNFSRNFGKILTKAGVRKGQFHDLRRTALSNWLASGMSENDVMTLAGHASFSTTHKFYLAIADDLLDRARDAAARGFGRNLARIWHAPGFADKKS